MTIISKCKVDSEMLTRIIDESGYKRGFIAERLGITVMTLWRKVNGETDFRIGEVRSLADLLKLDAKTLRQIFLL